MKPVRNKRHLQSKVRQQAIEKRLIPQIATVWTGATDGDKESAHVLHIKSVKPARITKQMAKTLTQRQNKYTIVCAVMLRDQFGVDYMQSETILIHDPISYDKLPAALNKFHNELIDTCNPKHIVNIGWVSCADIVDTLTEAKCSELFEYFNAWDYLAKWELEKQEVA